MSQERGQSGAWRGWVGRDTGRDGDTCKERQEGTRRERERFGRQKVKGDLSRGRDSARGR